MATDAQQHTPVDRDRNGRATLPAPTTGPPAATAVPITRGAGPAARPIGVVLIDRDGARWQPTVDIGQIAVVATVTAGAVAVAGALAAARRRPPAKVERIVMGPGGWVSFKGAAGPRPEHRPWWAVLLRAHRLDR